MPHTQVVSYRRVSPAGGAVEGFGCTVRDGGFDAAWVHVVGDLDIATAPVLEQALRRAEDLPRVVLDLRDVSFMDCCGVRVILQANIRALRRSGRLVLVPGPAQVNRALTLTGALDLLEVVDLQPIQPPVQALVQLGDQDRAA